jgi:hypothetical protein
VQNSLQSLAFPHGSSLGPFRIPSSTPWIFYVRPYQASGSYMYIQWSSRGSSTVLNELERLLPLTDLERPNATSLFSTSKPDGTQSLPAFRPSGLTSLNLEFCCCLSSTREFAPLSPPVHLRLRCLVLDFITSPAWDVLLSPDYLETLEFCDCTLPGPSVVLACGSCLLVGRTSSPALQLLYSPNSRHSNRLDYPPVAPLLGRAKTQ